MPGEVPRTGEAGLKGAGSEFGVCIDLKAGYRAVLRAELPGARIVADHFHVIADANRRLDETRRIEGAVLGEVLTRWPLLKGEERLSERQRTRLAELKRRFPTLAEQHWCKERLRELYHSPDRRTAAARWTSLLIAMEASDDPAVWQWARTLQHWRREILGYFELPIRKYSWEQSVRMARSRLLPSCLAR